MVSCRHMRCVYCGDVADTVDHMVPLSFQRSAGKRFATRAGQNKNLVPSCRECNNLAGNKIFDTKQDKKAYIINRLRSKYRKILDMPEWSKEEMEELSPTMQKFITSQMAKRGLLEMRIGFEG